MSGLKTNSSVSLIRLTEPVAAKSYRATGGGAGLGWFSSTGPLLLPLPLPLPRPQPTGIISHTAVACPGTLAAMSATGIPNQRHCAQPPFWHPRIQTSCRRPKKDTPPEIKTCGKISTSKHQLRGRRAVSAAGLQGEGSCKRSVCS